MFNAPRFDGPDSQKVETPDSEGSAAPTVSSLRSSSAPVASRPKTRRRTSLLVALAFIATLATGFAGGYVGSHTNSSALTSANITEQKRIAANESQLIASIAKTVGPSVVSVNVVTQSEPTANFFGYSQQGGQQEAAGTGIIISSEGIIVTNRHVVPAGTSDVSVTLSDGTELEDVKVIGRTNDNDSLDIAFLKINDLEGHKLTPAEIGDSGKVQTGDTVVAIGNALGQFSNSVTSGIISGFGRSVVASDSAGTDAESLDDLFQTDAAINQGNSGGPLVNTDGQVIGINTAVSGEGQNIGFAIPINDVSGLIKQILSNGTFERPYLGVRYIPITPDAAKQYKLDVESGAYVLPSSDGSQQSVISNGPADKAGVQEGDIISAIDGTKIDQSNSLTSLVGRHAVGDEIELTILRDGKTTKLTVKLQAMPSSDASS